MCGIVGAFDLTGNRDFPAEWLRAMTVAIAHRGPDEGGGGGGGEGVGGCGVCGGGGVWEVL